MMHEVLVEIQDLSKIFVPEFPPALKNITATIPHGEIVGLVGPDGAGKTTLIRLIAALLLPTAGWAKVAGKDTVKDPEFIHSASGYMPQRFGLYEDLTVIQNLNLYAELRGVVGDEKEETFKKLLTFTGLAPFQHRLAKALSGGMKQKLGLACALIKKPTLLLLDEPSVGVDPISRRELWKMVNDLLKEGISVIWSTAYLDEAEKCQTVLLLNRGELLYYGQPKALTERVKERVFLIKNVEKRRRSVLKDLLNEKGVIDGTIQGKDLRIVLEKGAMPPAVPLIPTQPRLEDAFIDILGGGPGGGSKLADRHAVVQEKAGTVVLAEKLTKVFGAFTAVKKIDLEVKRGEVFGLLGPNGAGKTTAFKMLCGLLRPTAGRALINGLDLQEAPGPARAQIGYMAQKFSLYGNLSVYQNLSFFSGVYNLRGARQKEAISKMVEIFDLKNYLTTSADLLPLGFKQRLSLACATMHDPPILFLDEPTSGVDPITRREFWNHINGLVEKGVTVLVTTHFMDEAEYCDRIALIYGGEIINMDTPDGLKAAARTENTPNPTLEDAFIHLIEVHDAG
jgi:ABC-2 type transport system ATP-binding protein